MTDDLGSALRQAAPPARRPLDLDALRRRADRRSHRRRAATAVGVVSLAAAAVVAVAALVPLPPAAPRIVLAPSGPIQQPGPEQAGPLDGGSWRDLPPAPTDNPDFPFLVWDGGSVLVLGGTDLDGDGDGGGSGSSGIAYDRVQDAWRPLPTAPMATIAGTVAVAGGVLAWPEEIGGAEGAPALLERATGEWRALPAAPTRLLQPAVAWTGREVLFWGETRDPASQRPGQASAGVGLALDPATGSWRELPPAPDGLLAGYRQGQDALSAAWSGTELIVRVADTSAAYDAESGTWRRLPPLADGARGGVVRSAGQDLVVLSGPRAEAPGTPIGAHRFTGDGWQELPPAPPGATEIRATDLGVLVAGTDGWWRWDPPSATWRALAPAPPAAATAGAVRTGAQRAVWTGAELVVWSDEGAAAAWSP